MLRLVRERVALGVCLGIVGLAPGLARADDWSLHVLGNGVTAWTDNVFSAPDERQELQNCPPGAMTCLTPEKAPDLYYQIRPGALFSYQTSRTIHELEYVLDGTFYTVHDEAWSLAHHVAWRGFFMTSPRSELTTGVMYQTGQTHTFALRTAANATDVNAMLGGAVEYVQGDATQGWSYALSRSLRMVQGTRARRVETSDGFNTISTGTEIGTNLGLDRSWRADSLGFTADASFVDLAKLEDKVIVPLPPPPDDKQIVTNRSLDVKLTATWRRDIGEHWTGVLDGGAVIIVPVEAGEKTAVQPAVGGQISYFPTWGSAGLHVRRNVVPDLYISQHTISDEATLNFWLPLPWLSDDPTSPTLSLQTTLGAQRTQILNLETGATGQSFNLLLADVALDWNPADAFHIEVRGQHQRQAVNAMAMEADIFDFTRTTVVLSMGIRWPERVAAKVPVRGGLRVDRTDVTPVGDETPAAGSDEATGVQRPR